jgi:hypothetical protein
MFIEWTLAEAFVPRASEPGRRVSSRLLDVLFAFRPGRSRQTLADLTRSTGMPHATVRRLALDLVDAGALDRAPAVIASGLGISRALGWRPAIGVRDGAAGQ